MNILKSFSIWEAHLAFFVIFFVSLSNGSPSRIQTLQMHRIRRAAEISTEPAPVPESAPTTLTSSSPSTMTMAMQMSTTSTPMSASLSTMETFPSMTSHESHEVDCAGDMEAVKKTCPDNSTCPLDEGNMEKCCHCLNICCGMAMASTSEESMMGSSTMKPGKNIGSKVKDAVNSAEGWIKNAGENIKNSWNKAKDSISSAASDVSDKVKKGINSVANRVRNSTNNSQSDCKTKDGKCTTEMSAGDGKESTTGTNSDDTTPVPGFQKSKRDLRGTRGRDSIYSPYSYSQISPVYDSRYSSSGYGNRDSSDSREYSWSKTTTTMGGSRDSNLANTRRYRRGMDNQSSSNSSGNPSPPGARNSPEKSNGRARRASGSGMGFSEDSRSSGGNCSTLSSNSWPSSSGRNGRQERDSPNQGRNMNMNYNNPERGYGRPSQQSISFNDGEGGQMRRTRRAASGGATTTETVRQMNTTTVTTPSRRNKREAKGSNGKNGKDDFLFGSTTEIPSNEDSEDDEEGSYEGHNRGFHGNGNGKSSHSHKDKSDDSNYSISVKILGPRGSNETKYSFSTGEQSDSDSTEQHGDYDHDHDHHDDYGHSSHSHRRGGGRERYHVYSQSSSVKEHGSKNSNDDYESTLDKPHSSQHIGSGGGVISGPNSNGVVHSSRDYTRGGGRSFNFNHAHDMGNNQHGQGGSNYNRDGGGGRQSHDFTNRGFIRSTDNDRGYYEPYEGSSSGIDVAYYPISENRPDASLTAQNSMSHTNQHHYYDQNQNRHQQNSRYYNSDMGHDGQDYMPHENENPYGWNGYNNNRANSYSNYGNSNADGMHGTTDTNNNNNYNSQSSYGQSHSNWGNMNPQSQSYDQLQSDSSSGGSGGSSSSSSNSNPNDIAYGKPGKCKPLKSGVHCLPLQPDSSQCLFDNDCSGPKKCCFYGCKPNKSVGLCELPVDGYVVSNNHGHHHDHNHGY